MGFSDMTNGNKQLMELEESYGINKSFPCDTIVGRSCIVVLKRDGTGVTPVIASTDKPLGVVTVGNRHIGDKVTVQVKFSAVVLGQSTQSMVSGNEVAAVSYNATTGQTIYKKAVQGDYIVGVCLVAVTGVGDVSIGLYKQPYLETAAVGS